MSIVEVRKSNPKFHGSFERGDKREPKSDLKVEQGLRQIRQDIMDKKLTSEQLIQRIKDISDSIDGLSPNVRHLDLAKEIGELWQSSLSSGD